MTHARTNDGPHISDEELDNFLLGEAGAEAHAHVAGCELCRNRVAEFEDAIAAFKAATMAWAEVKSSTMPLLEPKQPQAVLGWKFLTSTVAAFALAAAAIVATHRPVHQKSQAAVQPASSVAVTAAASEADPTPAQLTSDNALLAAIDREVQPAESPLAEYDLSHGASSWRRKQMPLQVRN